MEESAQRRERLKAMRMEASQEAATYNDGSEHSSLSNPLLESTPNPEAQVQSYAQGFNYYTDPMSAFSGNKQRSKVSPQISQDYSSTPPRPTTNQTFPSPALQPHLDHSPDPRMQQPHGRYANAYTSNAPQGPGGHLGSGRFGYPNPGPGPATGYPSPSHGPGQGYPSPGPHFNNNSPGFGSRRGYLSPGPYGPGRGGYPSPRPHHGPGQGGYPSPGPNQGSRPWFGNNMSSGRGRGHWSGQGGGRGQGRGGPHNHVSAEDRPDLFYNKSMVEDPWKFLDPVIWKSHKKPWLTSSFSIKKPRVSESPRQQQQSSNQPSLAEILAASFNDATTSEPEPKP